ncbi:MAG: YceI family protein, partial [Bacteroidota bacterium]
MKRTIVLIPLLLLFFAQGIQAQKYFTREGKITFVSDAAMEKIEAVTNSATSVIDMATGAVEFAVLIKGFQFKKALMQEHFNENYMESSKFPKATFKGKIDNFSSVNLKKD